MRRWIGTLIFMAALAILAGWRMLRKGLHLGKIAITQAGNLGVFAGILPE
jgi:hypothetical protein